MDAVKDLAVSIISATYNSDRTLRVAIQSVVEQEYGVMEHIVVDGASTDGTLQLLECAKSAPDSKLVYISRKDNGMYEAINRGIGLACGDIIGILNSDDAYHRSTVRRVVEAFAASDADVVFGNIKMFTAGVDSGDVVNECVADISQLNYRMSIPHPAVFVRKAAYEKYGMFNSNYKIAADYEFMLRLRKQGAKMIHLNAVLCSFRRGGISSTRVWRTAFETFKIQASYVGFVHALQLLAHRAFELLFLRHLAILFRKAVKRRRGS
jgi:glycosyltransferase involved in cell wall biosynthesis